MCCDRCLQVDAIGGARFDDGQGGDNEVQRTMLEIVNQLDGFDSRGNIKVCDTRAAELGSSAGGAGLWLRAEAQCLLLGFEQCHGIQAAVGSTNPPV